MSGPAYIRRIFTTRNQIPDTMPLLIGREFGREYASAYEQHVRENEGPDTHVEILPKSFDYIMGVDHVNQVVSYERLFFMGHIEEAHG